MTDLTFWSTMGQVSATFVGLLFVGLSIYLESIRSAIREAHLEYPLQENSSRLMYAAVLSDLSLLALPLWVSLGLILEQEHPQIQPAFPYLVGVILTAVLFLNLFLYWNKVAQEQLELLRAESRPSRKLLQLRLSLGAWGLLLVVVIYGGLLFALRIPPMASWILSSLKVISWLSIIIGLGTGIFDLIAFDAGNIFFRISEDFRRKTEDRERILKTQMAKIDVFFAQWRGLASDPQFVGRISQATSAAGWDTETVEKRFRESRERTILDYDDFKAGILRTVNPTTGCYRFTERIRSSSIITLKELQEMAEEVAHLLEATTTFLKYLSEKYERLEKWSKEGESQEKPPRSSSDQITAHDQVAVPS